MMSCNEISIRAFTDLYDFERSARNDVLPCFCTYTEADLSRRARVWKRLDDELSDFVTRECSDASHDVPRAMEMEEHAPEIERLVGFLKAEVDMMSSGTTTDHIQAVSERDRSERT